MTTSLLANSSYHCSNLFAKRFIIHEECSGGFDDGGSDLTKSLCYFNNSNSMTIMIDNSRKLHYFTFSLPVSCLLYIFFMLNIIVNKILLPNLKISVDFVSHNIYSHI